MVSIIIVNYKVADELEACIKSILENTHKISFEIIVVDNSADHALENKLKKSPGKITYLSSGNNIGYGAGNNLGAKKAKGEYLFFLNPDTVFQNDVLGPLYGSIKVGTKIAAVAPLLIKNDGNPYKPQGSLELTPGRAIFAMSFVHRIFKSNRIAKKFWLDSWDFKQEKYVDVIPGTAFMIMRTLFNKVGGFDEKFFLYFEEYDLSKRLRKMGYKLLIIPKAKLFHKLGASTGKIDSSSSLFEQSRFYYFKKHFGILKAICTESFLRVSFSSAIILLILLVGGILRFYKIRNLTTFIPDQGWFFWSAKKMLIDHQIPLVGITSSHTWIHQGPIWTYLLAGIFALTKFNPFTPAYFTAALGTLSILLIYFVTKNMIGKKAALVASFIYATSPMAILNDRLAYHTTLIPIFTLLLIYSAFRWVKGDTRFFPISFFLIGVLYNFEIATFSLTGTFILILLFGLIRKTKWARPVLNIKTIIYSLIALGISMIPMLIYDIHHGFPQTLKFAVWIVYRIAVVFGFPTLHHNPPGETWHTFALYNLGVLKDVLFLGNGLVALTILLTALVICSRSIYKDYKNKKFDYGKILLLVFFALPTLAFLAQKTNSGAYLLMLYPQMITLIGTAVVSFKNKLISAILVGLIVVIGLFNAFTLLRNNYFVYSNMNTDLNAARRIIFMSNNKPFNILGRGQGSQYESFVTPYKYLVWYLGTPASEKPEKLKFYVSEYPGKIKIETK